MNAPSTSSSLIPCFQFLVIKKVRMSVNITVDSKYFPEQYECRGWKHGKCKTTALLALGKLCAQMGRT
jgi:hypothetical protein